MKRAAKVVVGVLAVIGAAAIVLSVFAQFAIDCTTQRISSAASPSGRRVAEHYQTVCKDGTPKTEIQLVQDGVRVSTEIGVSTTNQIGLTWQDEDSLVVSVPPGMDKAFDRSLQGVDLKFRVVSEP